MLEDSACCKSECAFKDAKAVNYCQKVCTLYYRQVNARMRLIIRKAGWYSGDKITRCN